MQTGFIKTPKANYLNTSTKRHRSYKYRNQNTKDKCVNFILTIIDAFTVIKVPSRVLYIGGICLLCLVLYLSYALCCLVFAGGSDIQSTTDEDGGNTLSLSRQQTNENGINEQTLLQIDEVLAKLIEIRKNNNILDFEEFLAPIMDKYCLQSIPSAFFSSSSTNKYPLESFHLNLASILSFMAHHEEKLSGFENGFQITSQGSIIDIVHSNVDAKLKKNSISCPLLQRLHVIAYNAGNDNHNGTPDTNEDVAQQSSGQQNAAEQQQQQKQAEKAIAAEDDNSIADDFSKKFEWNTPALYIEVMIDIMQFQCPSLLHAFNIAEQKAFIVNFFEIVDQLGDRTTAAEEAAAAAAAAAAGGTKEARKKRKEAKASNKPTNYYVVGKDAHLYLLEPQMYSDDNYFASNEYMKCEAIVQMLNAKIVNNDSFQMTDIMIVMQTHEWFNPKVAEDKTIDKNANNQKKDSNNETIAKEGQLTEK